MKISENLAVDIIDKYQDCRPGGRNENEKCNKNSAINNIAAKSKTCSLEASQIQSFCSIYKSRWRYNLVDKYNNDRPWREN